MQLCQFCYWGFRIISDTTTVVSFHNETNMIYDPFRYDMPQWWMKMDMNGDSSFVLEAPTMNMRNNQVIEDR